jgi:hypothetical protein
MAFVPLPNGIKVCFNFLLRSVPVSFCLHVTAPATVGQTDVDTVAAIALDWWEQVFRLLVSQDLCVDNIQATDVSQQPAVQSTLPSLTFPCGDAAFDATPNQVAVVVSLRTAFIGRSYRGRVYIPGLVGSSIVDNQISTGQQTGLQNAFAALDAAFDVAGYTWVVASYQENNVLRSTAVGTPVETLIVNRRVDTQRRRLPR